MTLCLNAQPFLPPPTCGPQLTVVVWVSYLLIFCTLNFITITCTKRENKASQGVLVFVVYFFRVLDLRACAWKRRDDPPPVNKSSTAVPISTQIYVPRSGMRLTQAAILQGNRFCKAWTRPTSETLTFTFTLFQTVQIQTCKPQSNEKKEKLHGSGAHVWWPTCSIRIYLRGLWELRLNGIISYSLINLIREPFDIFT